MSDLPECTNAEAMTALYRALADACADIDPVKQDSQSEHGGYSYADHSSILAAIRGPMTAHGLSLFPVSQRHEEIRNKNGSHGLRLTVTYRLSHRDGGWVHMQGIGEGYDSRDKAPYIAQTGALKYVLRTAFALVVSDDPEKDLGLNQDEKWQKYRAAMREKNVDELALVACILSHPSNRDSLTPVTLKPAHLEKFFEGFVNGKGRWRYDAASDILAEAVAKISALTDPAADRQPGDEG